MIVVFLGAPGAGKGTQAKRVAATLGVPHVSTGELLRGAVEEGTELGVQAREYLDAGRLVPDDVMLGIIRALLAKPEYRKGFVLDGFPRTVPQAEGLDGILAEGAKAIDRVVFLDIPEATAIERLTARVSCPRCGAAYNAVTKPPAVPGTCDVCGAGLEKRSDDDRETVASRFEQYERATRPVIEYYSRDGRLTRIEAGGTIEDVGQAVLAALDSGRGR